MAHGRTPSTAARTALADLPGDLRDLLERARAGDSYAEIAAGTGSSYESVRRLVALALISVTSARLAPLRADTG